MFMTQMKAIMDSNMDNFRRITKAYKDIDEKIDKILNDYE